MKPTLLEALDEIPPKLCRLIARHPGRVQKPMTLDELVARSGLSKRKLRRIMRLDSFATVKVAEVDAYRAACGITPQNLFTHRQYIRKTFKRAHPLGHLGRGRGRKAFGVKLQLGIRT